MDNSFGDKFRRFFGFSNSPPSRTPPQHPDGYKNQEEHRHEDNRHPQFFSWNSDDRDRDGLDDMFHHFHSEMQTQMEAIQREMDNMFKNFGSIDFFPSFPDPQPPTNLPDEDSSSGIKEFGPRLPFWNPRPPANPRDHMLKPSIELPQPSLPESESPAPKGFSFDKIFTFPKWNSPSAEKQQDTDLDGKLSSEEIAELFKNRSKEPENSPRPTETPSHGHFRSQYSMSSYRGNNGRVEQKRVVRNSEGLEETTVTRSLGDQSHSVTTVTGKDGSQEKRETFQNMDEKDLDSFERRWQQPTQQQPSLRDSLIPSDDGLRPDDRGIFSYFFGRPKK